LATKLAQRNVPAELAARLLDRFEEVGLIDDRAFARDWIEQRQRGRGLAKRALAVELRNKGVPDDIAQEALLEIAAEDEEEVARALVAAKLRSVRNLEKGRATRRLVGMLARKGHSPGLAYRVVAEMLEV
ncbi:MAG TPA: regulatory protein RecX, partial [Marmoricola sp.]|nr:regulatory protein RecX [Marmoricola sp.]